MSASRRECHLSICTHIWRTISYKEQNEVVGKANPDYLYARDHRQYNVFYILFTTECLYSLRRYPKMQTTIYQLDWSIICIPLDDDLDMIISQVFLNSLMLA